MLQAAARPGSPVALPEAAGLLASALEIMESSALQQGVAAALGSALGTGEQAAGLLDPLWQSWSEGRQPRLAQLLLEHAQPAAQPPRLAMLSTLYLVAQGVLSELPARLQQNAAAVAALIEACRDRDAQIAATAARLLAGLREPAAQEEVCRWVIEHDDPHARQAALQGGYAPHSPQARALFFLLTGQWQRYESLDFDARLVEAVYAAGSESLRQQIASLARQRGWAGFVQAIAGGRARRRLGRLSEFEWEAVLVILGRERRWGEIWLLAQSAPPTWSARLLRSLQEAAWQPTRPEDGSAFERLAGLAAACLQGGPMQGKRFRHQAALYGHARQITALAVLDQHNLAASASADRTVRLWSLENSQPVQTLEGHSDFVLSLAYDPEGGWLASGSADKTVRLWSLPGGSPLGILGGHAGRVGHLAAAGPLLVCGDERSVYLWNPAGQSLAQVLRGQFNGLNMLGLPSTNLLLTGDGERTVKLWSLPGGELRRSLLTPIVGWCLSADGNLLASASSYSAVQLWKLPEGELLRTLPGRANNTLLAFSPDSRWLACADRSNVLLWDLSGTAPAFTLVGGAGLTSAITFSPDSRLLAAGNQDRTVRLWALPASPEAAPAALRPLEGYTSPVKQLAFTRTGGRLVSADDLSLHIWSVDDLDELLNTPPAQLEPARLESQLTDSGLAPAQRQWLEFSLELARWQRRFDIELHEAGAGKPIPIGDFDIEIEVEAD